MVDQNASEGVFPWFAVKVRARSERLIATILENKGYTTFVPTYPAKKVWSDRVIIGEFPLFPGYLFCQMDPNSYWLPILQTPGAKSFVAFGGVLAEVDREEIDSLRIAVESGQSLHPWPYLRTGQRVIVERGAFEGREGILLRTKSQDRLILSITLLQRSVAVEIERCWVRPSLTARPPHNTQPVRLRKAS